MMSVEEYFQVNGSTLIVLHIACIYIYVCIFDTRLLSPVSDNQIRFGKKYKARVNP